MSLKKFALAMAAILGSATAAQADVIKVTPDDIGTSYTLNYDGNVDGQQVSGLSAGSTFTLTNVSDDNRSYTFSYDIDNTSSSPITQSRISGFGFNTDPTLAGADSTGTFAIEGTGNAPNGLGKVDTCFKAGGGQNNCAGGGGHGVKINEDGTGSFTLNFSDGIDELTLSDFFVRYQSINGPGMQGDSGTGEGSTSSGATSSGATSSGATSSGVTSSGATSSGATSSGTQVPAPGGLWLFAAALGLIGWRFGRRRPVLA